jgi:hypothetical protein
VNSLLRLSVYHGGEVDCRLVPMALGATHRTLIVILLFKISDHI